MTKSPHPSSVDKGELLPVTQADNAQTLVLSDWLFTHDFFDEDGSPAHQKLWEEFGKLADQAFARHREFGRCEVPEGFLCIHEFITSAGSQAHSLPGDALEQAILWARDDKCSYPADAEKFEQRIEILRAALTPSALSGDAGEGHGWSPIETAPKDGRVVDLWISTPSHVVGAERCCDARWHRGAWWFPDFPTEFDEDDGETSGFTDDVREIAGMWHRRAETPVCKATHWRLAPPPPALPSHQGTGT